MLRALLVLIPAIFLLACNSGLEGRKQRFLETGKQYLAKQRYKEASILFRRAIQEDRRFSEAYHLLALTQIEQREFGPSLDNLQRVWELDPANLEAFRTLTDLHFLALETPAAARPAALMNNLIELYEQAKSIHPDTAHVLSVEGRLLAMQGETERAILVLRQALEKEPEFEPTTLTLALALGGLRRFAEAEQVLTEFLERDRSAERSYDVLFALFARQDRDEDAKALLREKAEAIPNNGWTWIQLAALYRSSGQVEEAENALRTLMDDQDRFNDAPLLAGDFYSAARQPARALEHYRLGLETRPDDIRRYRYRIVRTLISLGRQEEAAEVLGSMLEAAPNDSLALATRAELRAGSSLQEDRELASDDYRIAVSKDPTSYVLRYRYGISLLRAGDSSGAERQFKEALRLNADYIPPGHAMLDLYLARNQLGDARTLAESLVEKNPYDTQARLALGKALAGVREYDAAKRQLMILMRTDQRQNAVHEFARVFLAERSFADAEVLFRALRDADPPDPRWLRGVLELSLAQGRVGRAREILDEELEHGGESIALLLVGARLAIAQAELPAARDYLERILAQQQDHPEAHYHLATLEAIQGNRSAARRFLQRAMDAPEPPGAAFYQYGTMLLVEGKYPESRPYLERSLELNPDLAPAHNNLAFVLAETNSSLDKALAHAQRAVALQPGISEYADTLGYIYVKRGLYRSAIGVLEELLAKEPGRMDSRYYLALAYHGNGEPNRAIDQLELAPTGTLTELQEKKNLALLRAIRGASTARPPSVGQPSPEFER